jgi:hypothetical protein
MFLTVNLRDRGTTPRNLQKAMTAAKRAAWHDTAVRFHSEYRDKRFTEAHAREANYVKRKGEALARGSKQFRQSYTGRKLQMKGHTNPLEFSGKTRAAVRMASISSTTKGGKASYAGASTFNFKHPRSQIKMSEEFRRLIPREANELGQYFDQLLDYHLAEQDRG